MNRTRILTLIPLLVPLVAGAGALDVYGLLAGRTVLAPAALPALPDSIVPDSLADTNKAMAAMERALAERGVEVVQDGPHVVRVFRREARDWLTNAPLRGAELAASSGQETLPSGAINFNQADLNQVLSIYAVISQRNILRPAILPAPTVNLKTQGALSKREALYALATVLALNGIGMVDDGLKFVQVVPMGRRAQAQAQARAPQPEPGAKLFDPKQVLSVGVLPSPRPLTEKDRLGRSSSGSARASTILCTCRTQAGTLPGACWGSTPTWRGRRQHPQRTSMGQASGSKLRYP